MSILFVLFVSNMINWQAKYDYCETQSFEGEYCMVAKELKDKKRK